MITATETTATESHASRIIGRIRQTWAELDYAQRRLFEIRTGVPSLTRRQPPSDGEPIEELEALWIQSPHESDDERQTGDLPRAVR